MPRSHGRNAFQTNLSSEVGPSALTFPVDSTAGLVSPCYLTIEPNSPTRREYIYFDGTFDSDNLRTTTTDNRYLTGSAETAPSPGITHPEDAVVRYSPLDQHLDDIWDGIEQNEADIDALGGDIAHIAFGSYTGDGTSNGDSQFIDVGFTPRFVYVSRSTAASPGFASAISAAGILGGGSDTYGISFTHAMEDQAIRTIERAWRPELVSNGFNVGYDESLGSEAGEGGDRSLNEDGHTYHYVAIG